jgi:FixJ family two-component response regulator
MTDQYPKQDEDLGAEFRAFGENLKGMLHALWARPERQQLQNEIENGLNELGHTLRQTADEFSESEVGQRVKTGVEDFRDRVERGEVEKTIRDDLGKALRTVNAELQKLAEKLQTSNPPEEES